MFNRTYGRVYLRLMSPEGMNLLPSWWRSVAANNNGNWTVKLKAYILHHKKEAERGTGSVMKLWKPSDRLPLESLHLLILPKSCPQSYIQTSVLMRHIFMWITTVYLIYSFFFLYCKFIHKRSYFYITMKSHNGQSKLLKKCLLDI